MRRRSFIKLAATASVAAAIAADPVARLSASIITRPRRSLEKPPGAACMNWGHPLATGMQSVILFNEGQGVADTSFPVLDVCGGHPLQLFNTTGNVAWVTNTPGLGLKFAGNFDFINLNGTLQGTINSCTVLMIRRKIDTTLRAVYTFGTQGFTGDSFDALCPFSDGTVYWDFGGLAPPNRLTFAGLSWTTAVEMWAFTAGGKGSSIWKNGEKLASQSTAITRGGDVVSARVGSGFDTNVDPQEWYFFAVAGTQWTDDLLSWWFTDPYGMLVPQSPTMRYFFGGTGRKKTNVFVAM